MKRILVSGAAGFIGQHLCERLVKDGHSVVGVDIVCPPTAVSWKFKRWNVNSPPVNYEIATTNWDAVIHLASHASPKKYLARPLETLSVGSVGTGHMLEVTSSEGRFLLASTSEIYGDPLQHPQHESYWGNVNPIGPRSCYDESKRYAEALTMAYHLEYRVNTKIARIFNTYGPKMAKDDGRVIPNLINQALEGKPLTIYGDGSQTRSFCYIDDLVDGLVKLLWSDVNEPVNLGNPKEFTMLELAALVKEITNCDSPITHLPLPTDDPARRKPDIGRAIGHLGWWPTVSLRAGLEKTIAYFRQ
jgi:dTDP-glucose 4,6-dehydratase